MEPAAQWLWKKKAGKDKNRMLRPCRDNLHKAHFDLNLDVVEKNSNKSTLIALESCRCCRCSWSQVGCAQCVTRDCNIHALWQTSEFAQTQPTPP